MSSGQSPGPSDLPQAAARSGPAERAGSTIRHQSITELELAFAQDPQSTAYIPLCEAYLDQSRFMEAMVVCKKGLKAHPESIEAQLLLSRVYSRQKKFSRALEQLEDLIARNPSSGLGFLARGNCKRDSGDEQGAIADWKKAVDLEPSIEEAKKSLAERGIEYPPKPPPPPPPDPISITQPISWPGMPGMPPMQGMPGAPGVYPASETTLPPGAVMATYPPGSAPPNARQPSATLPPGMMPPVRFASATYPPGVLPPIPDALGSGGYSVPPLARPKLEGEEELEKLAERVAETKEDRGSPKMTLVLIAAGLVLTAGFGAYKYWSKQRQEKIDSLLGQARAQFDNDTYGSYNQAVSNLDRIIDEYDATQQRTLGMRAHAYAILWGEHGDVDRLQPLDGALAAAEKDAGDVSHTIAARGLRLLYGNEDRQKASAEAYDAIWPTVQKAREKLGGAGSVADLTAALIDLERGNYDAALSTLEQVDRALPRSVRAKVLHARAAFRAGRLGTAENLYSEALRMMQDHPVARTERALVRLQRGRLDEASDDVREFDKLARTRPKEISDRDRALAEYARSEAARALGDEARANGAYERAVSLDPKNADFPYGLGRWLLKRGRAQESLDPLKKAVQMEPNRVLFLIALAEAETLAGEYDAAAKHIDSVLARLQRNPDAAVVKAMLLARQRSPEAEKFHADFVEWSKGSAQAQLQMARFQRGNGKKPEAKAALEAAIKTMGNAIPSLQAAVLLEYGTLMAEDGDYNTALNSYRQAVELGELEGHFEKVRALAAATDKDSRKEAADSCKLYLAAGASLLHHQDAKSLCAPIMTP